MAAGAYIMALAIFHLLVPRLGVRRNRSRGLRIADTLPHKSLMLWSSLKNGTTHATPQS